MIPRSLRMPLLSLVILAILGRGESATYYVDSVKGNDSNSGISSAPWKTIQKAANTVEGGSVVQVRPGKYDERVVIARSGLPGALITFKAQGSVVTQGFTIDADYIRIDGFEITNSKNNSKEGTGFSVQGQYNQIRNNYIHDLIYGEGIWLYGGPDRSGSITSHNIVSQNRIVRGRIAGIVVEGIDNIIEGNDISHTIQNPPGAQARVGADADGIRFFGSGHIIRRNHIHDIALEDPGNTNPHIDAFQTWGPCTNIIIEQNQVSQIGRQDQGVIIEGMAQPVRDITIRNNLFMTNGTDYAPAVLAGDGGPVQNVTIVNNTIVALKGPSEYAIWLFATLRGAVVKNNALYDHGNDSQPYIRVDRGASGLDIGFNSISKSDGRPPAGTAYPGDLWLVSPEFADIATHDFHLRSTSPLIDAGAVLSNVLNDFDGAPRPGGASHDIGAFEVQ